MGTIAIPGAKRSSSHFRTDSEKPALPSRGSQSALARPISGEQSEASPGEALGTICRTGVSGRIPPSRGRRLLSRLDSKLARQER